MFSPGDTFPYIGLRPFSEDDSIYFKGREEHILQITALLESNKFLMVTGASGDGKSSLVYAVLVPNARAGFFKAHYANWVISDFACLTRYRFAEPDSPKRHLGRFGQFFSNRNGCIFTHCCNSYVKKLCKS